MAVRLSALHAGRPPELVILQTHIYIISEHDNIKTFGSPEYSILMEEKTAYYKLVV
jgi:hypothetical protein